MVGEVAARNFKPCSLELGGKNAIIILDDANLDLSLDGVLWGAFGTTGQRCTATSRVIVQKGAYRQFADRLPKLLLGLTALGQDSRALKLDRDVGTVQLGKRANLLLLQQDPTETIQAYAGIVKVILGGRALDPADLAAERRVQGNA